jgi:cell wall-associated NlpC family hydrolase
MLYVGEGKILHTTTRQGVTIDPVPRKVYEPDRYSLYRVPYLTRRKRKEVVAAALRLKGRKLDRAALVTNIPARLLGLKKPLLRFERNRLWCSRLIYDAYADAGIELLPAEGSGNVTSDDLARSTLLEQIELNI